MTFQRDLAWQHLQSQYEASIAYQCARYALALDYELLPEDVVHHAKRCVLDALGCAIGAYDAPGRVMCEALAKQVGGNPEATVFCSGLRTSVLNAALTNAFLVRFLDYSDSGGGGHNSDALASLLAVAEREHAGGKELLTALTISYEIGARFRKSTEVKISNSLEEKGWTTDIRGGLNQPPALGKLLGLSVEQIANAIGICMSHALPLLILDCDREENTMAKNLRFGWVAHDAIIACLLAREGFTGPVRVIESETGIANVIGGGEMDLEHLIDFSGWKIRDVKFKGMPANFTSHGHVMATLAIVKEQDLRPEDIEAVHITASVHEAHHTTTLAKKYPRNAESADHSAFYANALAIKERAFGPDSIDPRKFTNPVVLDLIERITVTGDKAMGRYYGASEILTKDGRRFQKRVDEIPGMPESPMSDRQLEQKFTEMAAKHLSDAHIRRLLDLCWNLEQVTDVGELIKLMVFPAAHPKP
jgi:2-methylcitrate dehydratase